METTTPAADRAMPGGDAPPRSPAMRHILDAEWFSGRLDFDPFHRELTDRLRNHEAVRVPTLPKCDFCPACATFDGKLRGRSSWANMCIVHFAEFGVGLGLGVGQELILTP